MIRSALMLGKALTHAPAFSGSLRRTLFVLLFGLVALPVATRAQDQASATVTVTAKKERVVKKLDKTVVDVSSMPTGKSRSGEIPRSRSWSTASRRR
jgi:hypothetical protein